MGTMYSMTFCVLSVAMLFLCVKSSVVVNRLLITMVLFIYVYVTVCGFKHNVFYKKRVNVKKANQQKTILAVRFHLLTKPVLFQDDYRVCLASGIVKKGGKLPCPVDASGKFTSEVSDFQGQHVKVQIQYTEMDDKFWQSACSCTLP